MSDASTHIEISIQGDPTLFEPAIGIMTGLGFEGFWEDEVILRCYIPEEVWTLAVQEAFSARLHVLSDSLHVPSPVILIRPVENRNWNEEWKKTIKPVSITDRITISPSWHKVEPRADEVLLIIDPKMSFGTGYHESTRLMLKLLERHVEGRTRILDLGTGTGVLAIAASKLGASEVVGLDNDDWSFDNARENVEMNHVQESVSIVLGDLDDIIIDNFEMILANIQRNVLLQLMEGMTKRLTPGGILILSGLLTSDEETMINAIHGHGLRIIEQLQENDWIALAARIPENPSA